MTVVANFAGDGEQYEYTRCGVIDHMLEGCFAPDPKPWTDLTLAAFGANYTIEYFRQLLKNKDGMDTEERLDAVDSFNVTGADEKLREFEDQMCFNAEDEFDLSGVPSSIVAEIQRDIDNLCQETREVVDLVEPALVCYDKLIDDRDLLIATDAHIQNVTLANLEAISCAWIKPKCAEMPPISRARGNPTRPLRARTHPFTWQVRAVDGDGLLVRRAVAPAGRHAHLLRRRVGPRRRVDHLAAGHLRRRRPPRRLPRELPLLLPGRAAGARLAQVEQQLPRHQDRARSPGAERGGPKKLDLGVTRPAPHRGRSARVAPADGGSTSAVAHPHTTGPIHASTTAP